MMCGATLSQQISQPPKWIFNFPAHWEWLQIGIYRLLKSLFEYSALLPIDLRESGVRLNRLTIIGCGRSTCLNCAKGLRPKCSLFLPAYYLSTFTKCYGTNVYLLRHTAQQLTNLWRIRVSGTTNTFLVRTLTFSYRRGILMMFYLGHLIMFHKWWNLKLINTLCILVGWNILKSTDKIIQFY